MVIRRRRMLRKSRRDHPTILVVVASVASNPSQEVYLSEQYKTMSTTDEDVMDLVDNCIGSVGADYDVARVVHALYKDAFQYDEMKESWYAKCSETHQWLPDRKGFQLRHRLSTDVVRTFMGRSLYWANQALLSEEDRERFKEKSEVLCKITIKLKTNRNKNGVVEECKAFFVAP
jgi:hypothetical protein